MPLELPTRFEADIQAFEAHDAIHPPPRDSVVFVGSSSIRLWDDLEADFAPMPVLNRGFGGSYLSDSVFYADRIVLPYHPRAVVVYAGENDLGNGQTGPDVFAQLQLFIAKIHATLPNTEIFFVSIKPSPGRGPAIEQIRIANELARDWAQKRSRVTYIDVSTPMLGSNGFGRDEFFVEDGVHMTRRGYELWTAVIKPVLSRLF